MSIVQKKDKFLFLPATQTSSFTTLIDTSYEKLGSGFGPSPYGYKTAFDSKKNFYAVGQFTTAGGNPVRNIAKWDGTSWSNVGGGTNGYLLSIYIDPSDNIYVGGQISVCDPGGSNVSVQNIAKWDGTSWFGIGGGVGGDVFTIDRNTNGDILVGGSFTTVGSGPTLITAINFSSWNGTNWFNYQGGVGNYFAGDIVREILVLQNKIYLCGRFVSTTTISANNVVMWDGSWNALGLGLNNDTVAMVTNGSKIYFAGGFSTANNIPVTSGLAVYDVSTMLWSGLPYNGFSFSIDIEIDQLGNLYVSGIGFFIRKFDGSSWSNAATGFNSIVRDMTIVSDGIDLYVTGGFTMINNEVYNYVAKIILAHNEIVSTTTSSLFLLPLSKTKRI